MFFSACFVFVTAFQILVQEQFLLQHFLAHKLIKVLKLSISLSGLKRTVNRYIQCSQP